MEKRKKKQYVDSNGKIHTKPTLGRNDIYVDGKFVGTVYTDSFSRPLEKSSSTTEPSKEP